MADIMLHIRKKLWNFIQANPFVKHVLTLVTGTAAAQAVGILFSIPLAWLYSPQAFGLLGIIQAIVTIGATFAALRYDMAIVLPKSDIKAKVVYRLAHRSILVVSLISAAACFLASDWFAHTYDSSLLGKWIFISGLLIFLTAQISNVQYWYTRTMNYRLIAINRVFQTTGVAVCQLLLYFIFSDFRGLVLGMIAGQLIALIFLSWQARDDLYTQLPANADSIRNVAKEYWQMPLLNGPNAIIDSIRLNGMLMVIGLAGSATLGQFNQAWKTIHVPLGLITGSVSQVFYQKMATIQPGRMTPLVLYTMKKLALLAIAPFAILGVISPWLIPFVFGPQWVDAGYYAQALVPWLFMTVITSPISYLFIVTHKQSWMLIFSILYATASLAVVYFSPFSMLATIWLLSGVNAIIQLFLLIMAIISARRFDQGKTQPASSRSNMKKER